MSDRPEPSLVYVEPKWWLASKTVIYNVIKVAMGILTALALYVEMALHQGTLPFYIDEKWLLFIIPLLLFVDGLLGVQLRTVTSVPVTRSKP